MIFRLVATLSLTAALLLVGCDADAPNNTPPEAAETVGLDLSDEVTFTERYRPQFHYTSPTNWMNDPNGLVYYDGQYHLFHQYNPFGITWGHMSWYHAVSDDLVHWDHQGVKIPEEGNEMIFSGSAVIDHENTSGFQQEGDEHPPMVAVYSSHYTLEGEDPDFRQSQSLAYSVDGGETFTKYEGNPVLEHEDPDFRDPNVVWQEEEERWLMVVALPTQRKVAFYESPNLIDWEHLSDFGPTGSVEGIWECPDFFQLPVDGDEDDMRWVLHVDVNPGAVAGGSGSQYFIGDFDGTTFTADEEISNGEPIWTDYGTDFYAAITWNDIPEEDGRRMWVGWMSNWAYANDKPTDPWRSAQSIPRSMHLRTVDDNIRLVQEPVEELQQLRNNHVHLTDRTIDGVVDLTEDGIEGSTLELVAEFDPGTASAFGLTVRGGDNEQTVIGYDVESASAFVDRTNAGQADFYENFAIRNDAPLSLTDNGTVKLHVLVDWSSVEVFGNDGAVVLTNRIFPDPESIGVTAYSDGGSSTLVSLDSWTLESVWE